MNTWPSISRLRACGLAACALYGPYALVFVLAEPAWVLVWLWPVFPGIAIGALLQFSSFFNWVRGMEWAILFSAVILGASLFAAVRFRTTRGFLAILIGLAVLSFGLVQVISALLRA